VLSYRNAGSLKQGTLKVTRYRQREKTFVSATVDFRVVHGAISAKIIFGRKEVHRVPHVLR